ncbi:ribosomal RNA small subunit methyltransferase A, partial [Candidatus Parcubacteria bacterium]|nr:ribosomal RNA small subunit methyltransferase A [Candidatus Parcubacteria bacterium]
MDLLQKTKQICKENNIKPARSRGQNFLINENVYDLIVNSAEIDKNDTVLEVGPGLGFLTEKLAKKAKRVIAVELDDKLADLLRVNLKEKKISNVEVVNENILDVNFEAGEKKELSSEASELSSWQRMNYKIVANIPYNITSVFLRKFLSSENKPSSMVLMLQKEVAERVTAKPGKMSLLAVSVQFYADVKIIDFVSKTDFWPMPAVDSAVVLLKIKGAKYLRFSVS